MWTVKVEGMQTARSPAEITAMAAHGSEARVRAAENARPGVDTPPEERVLRWIFVYATGALVTLVHLLVLSFQADLRWWEWPWHLVLDLVRADLWPIYWLLLR